MYVNACLFNTDNQSPLYQKEVPDAYTIFRRPIGIPQRYTNMAFSYWAMQICAKHFDEYLKYGKSHRPKTWRSVLFSYLL